MRVEGERVRASGSIVRWAALALLGALVVGACAPAAPAASGGASSTTLSAATAPRVLTVGITTVVLAFGLAGANSGAGGWMSATELHTDGLVTSAPTTRAPVGRLALAVPSTDDGSLVLAPDGTEQVTYHLRPGITWQDGAPFTAQDVQFSYALDRDPALPFVNRDAINLIQAVDAPDPTTVVLTFQAPFYLADALGAREFWLYPQHLLADAYATFGTTHDAQAFLNLPYWTAAYVNTGPFRLTGFTPGDTLAFDAYDGYFLGRPQLDTIRVRTFGTDTALYASLLAGAVDVFMDQTLLGNLGFQLDTSWPTGTSYLITGYVRMLIPQFRPELQAEPAMLDPPVRKALYQAIDRDALATALWDGHRELAAYAILPPADPNFAAAQDGLRPYAYDPTRALAALHDTGWVAGPDGALRSAADGHRMHTAIWVNPGSDQELATLAAYWRQIGLEVDEQVIPPELTRDNQYHASYPGWTTTANYDDGVLGRLDVPASAATHWAGSNQSGYDDPAARTLLAAYRQAIRPEDQLAATRAISEYVAAELPFLPFVYQADHLGARAGVHALDDVAGGAGAGAAYGTYTRDAYLWDLSS